MATKKSDAQRPPNILILWGDDVGYWNISANNRGMMGYRTPNIDRIANEGINFTDYYGQQLRDFKNQLLKGHQSNGKSYKVHLDGAYVANVLERFAQYPPRQKAASFNLDRVMERLTEGGLAAH